MQWVLGRGKSTIYMYGCLKIKQSSFYARIISIVAYQEKKTIVTLKTNPMHRNKMVF